MQLPCACGVLHRFAQGPLILSRAAFIRMPIRLPDMQSSRPRGPQGCDMPQHARLSYLVRQAQLATYQRLDQALRGFGLTPAQYTILAILSRGGESLSSAALARRLGVTPQSANEIVATLSMQYLRSEEHTSELQSRQYLVCRLLLEKKNRRLR